MWKKFKHQLSINFTKIEKRKIINPYTHIKEFGIPWANLQNITRIKINYKKKKKIHLKIKNKEEKNKNFYEMSKSNFQPTQRSQESSKDVSFTPNQTQQVNL